MKKIVSILVVILTAFMPGCSNSDTQPEKTSIADNVTPTPVSEAPVQNKYTKEDAIATFMDSNDFNNYEITDCVLCEDDKLPRLKAVILYFDRKENNSCNVAFITKTWLRE